MSELSGRACTRPDRTERRAAPQGFPVLTGGYLVHSHLGFLPPSSFYDMLEQSIEMYDRLSIEGFFVFAGSALQTMNASEWAAYDMPAQLHERYFQWLGSARVSVVTEQTTMENGSAAAAGTVAVEGAVVTVVYDGSTAVTRKQVGVAGSSGDSVSFGGWVGKGKPAPHTVSVTAAGYEDASARVQLQARQTVDVSITLKKKTQELALH